MVSVWVVWLLDGWWMVDGKWWGTPHPITHHQPDTGNPTTRSPTHPPPTTHITLATYTQIRYYKLQYKFGYISLCPPYFTLPPAYFTLPPPPSCSPLSCFACFREIAGALGTDSQKHCYFQHSEHFRLTWCRKHCYFRLFRHFDLWETMEVPHL